MADIYQCPVILIVDNFLAFSMRDLDSGSLDIDKIRIDRGRLLTDEELDAIEERSYKRYAINESGISPRAVPHHPNGVFIALGNEHTEDGRISEAIDNRIVQMNKRMRKMDLIEADEMEGPERTGPEEGELTLLGWGSTCGPIREAVEILNERDISVNSFHFRDVWPFPVDKTTEALAGIHRSVLIENNYTAQFARLLRGSTGIVPDKKILKYDGRPFSADMIIQRLIEEEEIHAG
jgi:2-oxoglutarate ferredoxin oxidoreductase subunit alpha